MVYRFLIIIFILTNFLVSDEIKNLKTFQADFMQNIDSNSGQKIKYFGKVYIKNNGLVLWQYKKPIIKNIYIKKNFAIIDEPELEQAIYTEMKNEINIIKILKTSKKINDKLFLAKINDVSYSIIFKNKKISKIRYVDKLDNSIEISFNNILQNSKIKDEIFYFSAPDYYDIIRQ